MADAGVRAARPEDVAEIARIQIDTWRAAYTAVLPAPVLAALTVDQARAAWAEAVTSPPSARHHVLVAYEQDRLVGFVALAPADGTETSGADDAEGRTAAEPDRAHSAVIGPLLVEPRWGRRGHGSRLLAAAVDHAVSDGMTQALAWVPSADAASLARWTPAPVSSAR